MIRMVIHPALLFVCLLVRQVSAQTVFTNNLAYNSPVVTRPDWHVAEPESAQAVGRREGYANGRNLLAAGGHASWWGNPSSDANKVFPQGVASGDPTDEGVMLWTRVPRKNNPSATPKVEYIVANDKRLRNVVKSGFAVTSADVDFTVKVDAKGLRPKRYYYYQFRVGNSYSPIGRTKTLPRATDKRVDRAAFGVASCAWLAYGYFNAYNTIADFADTGKIDAMLHLGDYLYEYNTSSLLPAGEENRSHRPAKEMVTLEDYRTRHEQWDSDKDLKRVRASTPLIAVWDDHEFTNNAFRNGAQNHNNSDGEFPQLPWEERKTNAIRAYYEYMPIRQVDPDNQDRIYRKFQYGRLASLLMLDTRFIGRDQEYRGPYNSSDLRYYNSSRSLLGTQQRKWLRNELLESDMDGVTWKVLGQQVVFAPEWRLANNARLNTDSWDGYAAERERILDTIEQYEIDNVVVLTGDVHASFAQDVAREPQKPYEEATGVGYDPATGKGSLAVEMVCNSVTSGPRNVTVARAYENNFLTNNRNIKYVQAQYKGFLYLELTKEEAAGTWVDVSTTQSRNYAVTYSDTYVTEAGDNHIVARPGQYLPKTPSPAA